MQPVPPTFHPRDSTHVTPPTVLGSLSFCSVSFQDPNDNFML